MNLQKIYLTITTLIFAVTITACDFLPDSKKSQTSLPGNAVIAASDYSTGSISSVDIAKMTTSNDILKGGVDSDLRVRSFNNLIYVLNNSNHNVQLLDPAQNYKTLAQAATGAYSYPHDIIVAGDKGYLALNGSPALWIINSLTLAKESEIDLSSYAPAGAMTPSVDQLWLDTAAHHLYVSIGRISYSTGSSAADYSSILVIDTVTNTVKKEIKLQWTVSETTTNALNPYSKFVYASKDQWDNGDGHGHLFVLCQGFGVWGPAPDYSYSDNLDGGIVAIDTTDLACETGFLVSEGYISKAMSDFDFSNGKFYVTTTSPAGSDLFVVHPADADKLSILHTSAPLGIPFAKVNSMGLLLAGDRSSSNPGIWIFNTADDLLENSTIISTGLPPADITLME